MAGRDPWAVFRAAPDWIWRTIIFLLALLVLLLVTTRWRIWETNATRQSTDDAYLQSDLTPIAARVAGYIREMPVQDYERVKKGQLIAQLVDEDYRATVRPTDGRGGGGRRADRHGQGAARLAGCECAGGPGRYQCSPGQCRAKQPRCGAPAEAAKHRFLLGRGGGEAESHGGPTGRAVAAGAGQATAAEHQLVVLDAQKVQAEAALAAQQATLEVARINLGYTRILAPEDGVISQRQVKPGQLVGVGGQITTLTPLPRIWVLANYKETQLTHMDIGAPAAISVDAFPGHSLRGKVLAFAPGAGSQFALLPPDNATGNFTKVVQRVAVKISIEDADGLIDRLRPGMSVVATVNTRSSAK
ncbi:MAG: HlyD family secretion protein [Steroidobacteraceae bacterium]